MSNRPDWNDWILQKNAEHEAEELKKSEFLEKAEPGAPNPHKGSSVFNMGHVREIAAMRDHGAAKKRAHEIVDADPTALPQTKKKIKFMIDRTKNPGHLSQAMSNHIMAHDSEDQRVIR